MRAKPVIFATFALAALTLAGCGFRPLYGRMGGGPAAPARFASIYVPPIQLENAGYELRNDLIDWLGAKAEPEGAAYDLEVDLRDRNQAIAIQNNTVGALKEVEITRYNYTLIADYRLIDRKTHKLVTKGVETSLSAYDVAPSPYATLVAQKSAQAHTAEDIAQQLKIRLAVFFAQNPGQPK